MRDGTAILLFTPGQAERLRAEVRERMRLREEAAAFSVLETAR